MRPTQALSVLTVGILAEDFRERAYRRDLVARERGYRFIGSTLVEGWGALIFRYLCDIGQGLDPCEE